MSFFREARSFSSKVQETFRDHARDDICISLQNLGIDAQMAERGRAEEKIRPRFIGGKSLGVIDIPDGPIGWINIHKSSTNVGGRDYLTEYGVPDPKLGPNSPKYRIKSTRVKNIPIVGRVVDLRWKGKDFGLGIIVRLNSDNSVKHSIMKSRNVTIRAHGDYRCWIISDRTRDAPSQELWNCYQAIAQHLLTE